MNRVLATACFVATALCCFAWPAIAAPFDSKAHFALERESAKSVRLQLDRAFYDVGNKIQARLSFATVDPKEDHLLMHVASETGDVEAVVLKKVGVGRYETAGSNATVAPATRTPKPHDGRLETRPGGRLVGLVFIDPKKYALGMQAVADVAIAGTNAPALARQTVVAAALSDQEKASHQTAAPFGVLLARGGLPLEVAIGQVIFTPNGMADLKSFLAYSGGKVMLRQANGGGPKAGASALSYLVKVPLERGRVDRLPDLRNLFAEKAEIVATQRAALQTFALILEYRLKGFAVSANPRLQPHGAFSTTEMRTTALGASMQLTDRTGAPCRADDLTCPINVPRLWAHMALWDLDEARVPVAFLDQGFATASPDFRRPAGGTFRECDFERIPELCATGVANTTPTVGASLFGTRVWHGTGSVATAGGVLNNAWTPGGAAAPSNGGTAGPGGQILVPMLYRMGLGSYAFQMGAAITRATDDGAACINIAAGYPCNIRLTLVGDFELCNPAARTGACAALVAAVGAAAAAASAAACGGGAILGAFIDALIPGAGGALAATACAAATTAGGASLLASIAACGALVALGDVSGPMQAGVDHATERGVPIIASMGNRLGAEFVPPELRPFLDPATLSLSGEQLRVIPATLPPVVSVGAAVIADAAWVNSHIRGASVAVWAPEINEYVSPTIGARTPTAPEEFTEPVRHGGTSAASSYVTGIVAAMQAANPLLNPNTPTLTAAQRREIPRTISRLLRSSATPMGTGLGEPLRLPMVDPWRALRAAWGDWPAGFDEQMNFDDTGDDDAATGARHLEGPRVTGSIITVRGDGAGGPAAQRDLDFYWVGPTAGRASTFRVTLRFPEIVRGTMAGRLELAGAGWTRGAEGWSQTGSGATRTGIRAISYVSDTIVAGSRSTFRIGGVGDDDNVYTLDVTEFPGLSPDRFDRDTADNLSASRPDNDTPSRAVPIGVAGGLAWPAGFPSRLVVPDLNFHDARDEDWFVLSAYPPAAGSGTRVCRHIEMPRNPGLLIEYGDGITMSEVPLVRVSSGPNAGQSLHSLTNPPPGTFLRVTRRTGSTEASYRLEITHGALAASGLGPGACP